MRRLLLTVVALGLVGAGWMLALGPTPASAGLLELLFGAPAATYAPAAPPMTVVVRPRRSEARRVRDAKAPGAKRKLAKRLLAGKDAKPAVSTRIDPNADPDWHLHDPTLRRGDILVLRSGPVVFEGKSRAARVTEDFVSLKDSRLVSQAGRREVRMMVTGMWLAAEAEPARAARSRRSRDGREASADRR